MFYDLSAAIAHARESSKMTRKQAAELGEVSSRAWSAYESSTTHRAPTKSVVRCFFARSGIRMPPEVLKALNAGEAARVISITSLKGGVGKSPITLDVAACLCASGHRVAIVTYDYCYEDALSAGEKPSPGSLVSHIDFYGAADVFFSKADNKALKRKALDIQKNATTAELRSFEFGMGMEIEELMRRLRSPISFKDLKRKYDYVLLDLNREVELIKSNSDVVAVILDGTCAQSIDCAEGLYKKMMAGSPRSRRPRCYGLMTNCDIGGRSRALEAYCERIAISEADADRLEADRLRSSIYQERILGTIRKLSMPRLYTHLTSAHQIVIDRYNAAGYPQDEYSFFDSVLDIAPCSHAADEIERLTAELIDFRT